MTCELPTNSKDHSIALLLKENLQDPFCFNLQKKAKKDFSLDTGKIKNIKIFRVFLDLSTKDLETFAKGCLKNSVSEEVLIDHIPHYFSFKSYVLVGPTKGQEDEQAYCLQVAMNDFFNHPHMKEDPLQRIFSQGLYLIENSLSPLELETLSQKLLACPHTHEMSHGLWEHQIPHFTFPVREYSNHVELLDPFQEDFKDHLMKERSISFQEKQMEVILDYFSQEKTSLSRKSQGFSSLPTDCEIETLFHLWKKMEEKKEQLCSIQHQDKTSQRTYFLDSMESSLSKFSLDKTFREDFPWIFPLFQEKQVGVRIDPHHVLHWTSACSTLNKENAHLQIKTFISSEKKSLSYSTGGSNTLFSSHLSLSHPEGYFSPSFLQAAQVSQAPLYMHLNTQSSRDKEQAFFLSHSLSLSKDEGIEKSAAIQNGDILVFLGPALNKNQTNFNNPLAPSKNKAPSALLHHIHRDFIQKAAKDLLLKKLGTHCHVSLAFCISLLARQSQGVFVDLERIPLSYGFFQPWEIFLSQAADHFCLVVSPEKLQDIEELAHQYEINIHSIGHFSDSQKIHLVHKDKAVALLDLFLLEHPFSEETLFSTYERPKPSRVKIPAILDYKKLILKILNQPPSFFHKISKSAYLPEQTAFFSLEAQENLKHFKQADAQVIHIQAEKPMGILYSYSILEQHSDTDAYHICARAFDQAISQIIASGGCLPSRDCFFLANAHFYLRRHPQSSQEKDLEEKKRGELVRAFQALSDMALFFKIPINFDTLYSKSVNSSQNTFIYNLIAKGKDPSLACPSTFRSLGDSLFLLGTTYDEMGGSELYRFFGEKDSCEPKVRKKEAKSLYEKVSYLHSQGLLKSCLTLNKGGLLFALFHAIRESSLGIKLKIQEDTLSLNHVLFSESPSRFLVSVRQENQDALKKHLGSQALYLGRTQRERNFCIEFNKKAIVDIPLQALKQACEGNL